MTDRQLDLAIKKIEKNISKFHPDGEIASMMRFRYRELKQMKLCGKNQ